MGILKPISVYVNTLLKDIMTGKKSEAFASEREKRAIRHVQAYQKNAAVIAFLNHQPIKKALKD